MKELVKLYFTNNNIQQNNIFFLPGIRKKYSPPVKMKYWDIEIAHLPAAGQLINDRFDGIET